MHWLAVRKDVFLGEDAAQLLEPFGDIRQPLPKQRRGKLPVAPVQRSQHEVGGAGAGEHRHGTAHPFRCGINVAAHMEVGGAGEPGQHLVGGVTAVVRPQLNGVAAVGEKRQMCAVGVVHQQACVVLLTKCGKSGDVCGASQIVRRGEIDARRTAQLL